MDKVQKYNSFKYLLVQIKLVYVRLCQIRSDYVRLVHVRSR
jgi:hypothetical protein